MTTAPDTEVIDYEDDDDAALRKELGLRPIVYHANGGKGTHPDRRPCPPWCWVGKEEGDRYEHEVDPRDPMEAMHADGATARLVASLYPAPREKVNGERVGTATIEAHLEQRGQGSPVIRVGLRAHHEDCGLDYKEILRLSLTDAEELSTVLRHFVRQAE